MVFFKVWKIFHALVIITFLIDNLVFTEQSYARNLETIVPYNKINNPLKSDLGMVSSQQWLASEVGAKILEEGGNAVDAAVATGFALAVVLPRAGNVGGGGFMMVYLEELGKTIAIDYREMAPALAHEDLFLDESGNVDNQLARYSGKSAGVPGTVAGLIYALEKYGTMTLKEVLSPAIELAENGFIVGNDLEVSLRRNELKLSRTPAGQVKFYPSSGDFYKAGDVFRQPDLTKTLKRIEDKGVEGFYRGETADLIVAEMARSGGIITHKDLENFKVAERSPVLGTYRGHKIVSMPPSSSGGIHVIQMLNILENFDMKSLGQGSAASAHLLTESMKLAYADRSKHLGDPDHWDVPRDWLTSKAYAKSLAKTISIDKTTPSIEIHPGEPAPYESPETTHFSVADNQGNVVVNTYTLNFSYGSGITVAGAGFLLNNEMDDFSAKANIPNGYGLLGGDANSIQPTKRPLSSMSPTFVFKGKKPLLLTGSPGGSRIISTVLQVVVNVLDYDLNVAEAVARPRMHHQWLPDVLVLEPGFDLDTINTLREKGHNIGPFITMGSANSIMINGETFYGGADPRKPDAKSVAPKKIISNKTNL